MPLFGDPVHSINSWEQYFDSGFHIIEEGEREGEATTISGFGESETYDLFSKEKGDTRDTLKIGIRFIITQLAIDQHYMELILLKDNVEIFNQNIDYITDQIFYLQDVDVGSLVDYGYDYTISGVAGTIAFTILPANQQVFSVKSLGDLEEEVEYTPKIDIYSCGYYTFTPKYDGTYSFTLTNPNLRGWVSDTIPTAISQDATTGEITADLVANQTYYICIGRSELLIRPADYITDTFSLINLTPPVIVSGQDNLYYCINNKWKKIEIGKGELW